MKFAISPQIFQDFPGLFVSVIVAKNINNKETIPEFANLLREVEVSLKEKLKLEEVTAHPHIATWREAYKKFGSNPRDFRPSNEALARIVLNGRQIRNINPLVDLYNYISLKYILTLGGEDTDTIQGDLALGYASGTEQFIPLGQAENDPPKNGEVVYKDNLGVICRRWNWREGDRTKLTKGTKNSILVIEGLPPIDRSVIIKAAEELSGLIKQYCGGETKIAYLDKNNPVVDIG